MGTATVIKSIVTSTKAAAGGTKAASGAIIENPALWYSGGSTLLGFGSTVNRSLHPEYYAQNQTGVVDPTSAASMWRRLASAGKHGITFVDGAATAFGGLLNDRTKFVVKKVGIGADLTNLGLQSGNLTNLIHHYDKATSQEFITSGLATGATISANLGNALEAGHLPGVKAQKLAFQMGNITLNSVSIVLDDPTIWKALDIDNRIQTSIRYWDNKLNQASHSLTEAVKEVITDTADVGVAGYKKITNPDNWLALKDAYDKQAQESFEFWGSSRGKDLLTEGGDNAIKSAQDMLSIIPLLGDMLNAREAGKGSTLQEQGITFWQLPTLYPDKVKTPAQLPTLLATPKIAVISDTAKQAVTNNDSPAIERTSISELKRHGGNPVQSSNTDNNMTSKQPTANPSESNTVERASISELKHHGGQVQSSHSSKSNDTTPQRSDSGTDNQYIVQQGDTLSDIAQQHGSNYQTLATLNNLAEPYTIYPSQKLELASNSYTVQAGDTLSEIARQHNLTTDKLTQINNLQHSDTIFSGQQLRLSAEQTSTTAPLPTQPSAQNLPDLGDILSNDSSLDSLLADSTNSLLPVANSNSMTVSQLNVLQTLGNALTPQGTELI